MSSKNINFSFDIVNKLKAVMADVATVAIEKEELAINGTFYTNLPTFYVQE